MAFVPRYQLSQVVLEAAEELNAARAIVELLPLPFAQVRSLRREASIRVAHHSTWIENRTLELEDAVALLGSNTASHKSGNSSETELRNYFEALALIDDNLDVAPDEDWMRRLHACIMRGDTAGRPRERSEYRQNTVQIGNLVYLPPAWEDVPRLMGELSQWASNAIDDLPDYLFAAILAYQFVTIHPFMDGNGRTCRALATWAIRRRYDRKGLLNVEEFYVRDLEGYYASLQMGLHPIYYESNEKGSRSDPDLSEWLDYFCACLGQAAQRMRASISSGFRARHPKLLEDPLGELPQDLRRFLVDLDSLALPFGAAEVRDRFGVASKTARAWLRRWQQDGFVEPATPGAKRVHKFRLTVAWLERLDSGS